jgi:hypothetical protein
MTDQVDVDFGPDVSAELKDRIACEVTRKKLLEEAKAKYKIEIHFGPDRSQNPLKPSAGLICIWESGKKFHGGGDDQMFWCGYDDCQHPFSSDNLALMHVVCPKCRREQFTDHITKQEHIDVLSRERRESRGIEKLPCMSSEKLFRLPPTKIATLLEKTFRALDSNADIYLKYHPKDIRIDKENPGSAESINKLVIARLRKQPVIYPLANILKDTTAGASLHGRLLAMVVA